MYEILSPIITNLSAVGAVFGIYVLTALCYIVASLYYNVIETKREKFDGHKLMNGIFKMLCLGFTSALLSVVATLIPQYLLVFATGLGMDIGADMQDLITIGAIVAMYTKAIFSYFTGTTAIISEILDRKIIEIEAVSESLKNDDHLSEKVMIMGEPLTVSSPSVIATPITMTDLGAVDAGEMLGSETLVVDEKTIDVNTINNKDGGMTI